MSFCLQRGFVIAALVLALLSLWWLESDQRTMPPVVVSEKQVEMTPPRSVVVDRGILLQVAEPQPLVSWVQRYEALGEPAKIEILQEGEALAEEHREQIKQLIVKDPEEALKRAVPMVVRQKLPPSIVARLERRISAVGRLDVLAVSPDSAPTEPVVRRFATVDGEELRAHVYGRRAKEMTLAETRLHGIAVDRELAVSESPLRVLEPGEEPDPLKPWVNICPISGEKTEMPRKQEPVTDDMAVVDDGKQIIYLCDGGHIRVLEEELVAGEGMTGGPQTTTGTAPITRLNSTGLKKYLYMRVIFPDALQEPQTEKDAYNNCRQLTDYFQENSYGRLHYLATVTPTLMLPRTSAWYQQDYTANGSNSPIMNDSKDAARALGYVVEDYQQYVCLYTGGPGTFGGLGNVNGPNTWLRTTSVGTFEHEFGHNIGVWHSNSWNTSGRDVIGSGANVEYGHVLDVMGSSGSGGHFNASMKDQLQWITPEIYHTVIGSGTYRMYQFDQVVQDPARRYGLKVAKDADRDYWVEFRQKHTAYPWFMSGASVNWSPWGHGNGQTGSTNSGSNLGTQLLDVTAGSADDRNDSPIVIGKTFSDKEAGVHITPVSKVGSSPEALDVVVNVGAFSTNNAPTLTLAVDNSTPAAGGTVNFTATADDVDGDTLAYYWDFGDKLASYNGNSFSINNSPLQAKSYAAAGYYQVLCTVSDMKGGSVTKSLLVTVGTPTTFYVEGTVTAGGNPMGNVRISRTTGHLTYTDSDGVYRLTAIANGTSANLAALLGGYSFTAGFANPVTVSANQTGLNWTAGENLPRVSMEIVDGTAAETGTETATLRLTRTGATTAALVVYTDFQGTATTADYTLAPTADTTTASPLELFTIPAGAASLDIVLTPVDDSIQEGEEVVNVSLINGPNYMPTGAQLASLVIADSDTPRPRVTVYATDPEATEDSVGSTGEFVFTRTGSTATDLTVTFTVDTTAGNATGGTDYTSIGTSVLIPTGQSSASVVITPLSDALVEGLELVRVTVVSNANHLAGTPNAATIKIIDDDINTVTLSAVSATLSESGATAANPGIFTFTRTGDVSLPLVAHYGVAGDATHGVDYLPLSGVVSFAPGAATATVEVIPINDSLGEPNQTIILQLRSAVGYLVGANNRATITLTDDGDLPVVSVNCTDGIVSEAAAPGTGTFRITTSGTGTGNITVNYTISGTATSGTDFTALSGTLSMARNATANITVTPINDALVEGLETVILTLTPSAAYQLDFANSATMAISDDDQPVIVHAAANVVSLTEGGSTTYYVSRTGSTTAELVVNYTMGGSATSGTDYTAPSGSVTIPVAAVGATIAITTIDDSTAEGVEDILLQLTPDAAYGVGTTGARIRLLDNDSSFSSTVAFATESTTVDESHGAGTINVVRGGTTGGTVTVEYAITTGTASNMGIDYSLANGVLTFGSGVTSQTVPYQIVEDVLPEEIESFTVLLRNANAASLGVISQHTVLIRDNEPRVSIRATDPFAQEGNADTATFRITRTGPTTSSLVVPLLISGTATAGTDTNAIGPNVTIPMGASYTDIVVNALNQAAAEPVETLVLSLAASGASVPMAPSSATVSILDLQTEEAPHVAIISPTSSSPGVPAATLVLMRGLVSDEGSPTLTWSKVSGPGTVTFGTPTQLETTASFSAAGTYVVRLSANDGALTGSADITLQAAPSAVAWTNTNVGTVGTLGVAAEQFGSHAVVGAGSSISGSADSAYLRHRSLSGDGSISARVRSTTFSSSSARIGVMLRDSTTNNVRMAAMTMAPMTGNQSVFNYRATAATSATTVSATGQSPGYWVRLSRAGNVFTASDSPDGINWTQRGTPQTLAMGSTVLAGLVVNSANSSRLNTAIIDNVTLTGAASNIGPLVGAGTDRSELLNATMTVSLSGTSSDDGVTPAVSYLWSQVSGPGASTFSSATSTATSTTVSAPGVYVYRLSADDGEITTADDVTLTLTSPVYDWRVSQFGANASNPAIAGDDADPDLDGIENLLEYALLMNPNQAGGLPVTSGRTSTHCTLTYTRPVDALDVNYVVEYSDDLENWSSVGVTQTIVSTVGNVRTMRAEVPVTVTDTRRFMQVKVTRP
jgi:hypothetical protein